MGFLDFFKKYDDFLEKWPGKKQFGVYRFLPIFFVTGALIEFLMIKWSPNGINFYEVYMAKEAHAKALERLNNWKEIEAALK